MAQKDRSADNNTITVNTIKDNNKELVWAVNMYPSFLQGKVIFKDSAVVEARLNYNRLYGQILFLSAKGDTLMLAHPETIHRIIIGNDTYHFFDKSYVKKITENEGVNLHMMQTMKYIGSEKKGPYGTYTPLSASNSNSTFTNDDQVTQYISIDENKLFKSSTTFYLSDKFNNFFDASKNNFYKIFFNNEQQIREYISTNKTNFKVQEDLVKLLKYIQAL